jgi:hypothetical protein
MFPPLADRFVVENGRKDWPWKQDYKCSPYFAEPFAGGPDISSSKRSALHPRSKSTQPASDHTPSLSPIRSKSSLGDAAAQSDKAALRRLPNIAPSGPVGSDDAPVGVAVSSAELRGMLALVTGTALHSMSIDASPLRPSLAPHASSPRFSCLCRGRWIPSHLQHWAVSCNHSFLSCCALLAAHAATARARVPQSRSAPRRPSCRPSAAPRARRRRRPTDRRSRRGRRAAGPGTMPAPPEMPAPVAGAAAGARAEKVIRAWVDAGVGYGAVGSCRKW